MVQPLSRMPESAGRRAGRTIFILGTLPRSGTNFLHRLVCLHPDCGAVNTTPIREDYLMRHGELLASYVDKLGWQWGHWGDSAPLKTELARKIGDGITDFLHSLTDAEWVVTKTPSVMNVDLALDFFPDDIILFVVRDGRSVVASGIEGFGWSFETATRRWAHAVRSVTNRTGDSLRRPRHLVVRYESLRDNPWKSFNEICEFIGLDPEQVRRHQVDDLPVFGSSFLRSSEDRPTWQPIEKPDSFGAVERWEGWSRLRHERFNWIAADELTSQGYEPKRFTGLRLSWRVLNMVLDVLWALRTTPGRLVGAIRSSAKAFSRRFRESRF